MRRPAFIPDAGDVVWLQFDPQAGHEQAGHEQAGHEQAGHEQAGHRPGLVLSPANYNGKTGLMVCCPLTSRIKGYPFEVLLASQSGSAVLADQVKNLDWRVREATLKGRVTDMELRQVRAKLRALIG